MVWHVSVFIYNYSFHHMGLSGFAILVRHDDAKIRLILMSSWTGVDQHSMKTYVIALVKLKP